VTLLLGAVVVGIDAAPGLGRDLGGVLAAVPAFLLLALLLTGARITAARLTAALGAAVLVAGTVAVLDWLRPADQRTHLGRFVQQLLDGGAWTVVSRKAQDNLAVLTGSSLTWLLPVALVAAVWLVRPGGRLRSGALRGLAREDRAALRAGLLAVAVALGLGAAVNDSGVAVPATAAALLVPLLVWLAADRGTERDPSRRGEGRPGAAAGEERGRVTVGSRGSSVRNA
jgi:tryptophan-rich sensory protein